MEVTYTPGAGVLVGSGNRWLLMAADGSDGSDSPDEVMIEALWSLITGSATTDQVLAAVEGRYGSDHPLVLVDLTPGTETMISRGSGRLTTVSGAHTLRLVDGPEPVRRLVGGAVAASAARLRPGPELPARPGVPPLIDGIPPEILAAVAADPPPPPPPSAPPSLAPVETDEPPDVSRRRMLERMSLTVRRDRKGVTDPPAYPLLNADHDGQTTYRPDDEQPTPASAPVDHLQQPTHETVLAVHCPTGHVTAAYSPTCRVCRELVAPQEPHRMPRPLLGVLHLPDGEQVPLDRGVVLGRQPAAPTGSEGWPHLVRLPTRSTYVSRSHLLIELDGWLVLVTDLGSRAGTTLRVPGRAPERIRAHERYVWEPGHVLDLADSCEIVYEVTS